jgi:NTP pyrophosphatase (non-canonical NTP hydrolase)
MNDKQSEVLRITQEECAEVIQAISKVFRFGLDETFEGKTNKQGLASELGDLQCMINLIQEHGIVSKEEIRNAEISKRNRLQMWSTIFEKEVAIQ